MTQQLISQKHNNLKKSAHKHLLIKTQARNTGSINLQTSRCSHQSRTNKNTQLNRTLVKTKSCDLRHRLLDALLSACSPVEAQLNSDNPSSKLTLPLCSKNTHKQTLTWLISSEVGTVSFTSVVTYRMQYQYTRSWRVSLKDNSNNLEGLYS